jgi:hypothetical protein
LASDSGPRPVPNSLTHSGLLPCRCSFPRSMRRQSGVLSCKQKKGNMTSLSCLCVLFFRSRIEALLITLPLIPADPQRLVAVPLQLPAQHPSPQWRVVLQAAI